MVEELEAKIVELEAALKKARAEAIEEVNKAIGQGFAWFTGSDGHNLYCDCPNKIAMLGKGKKAKK